MNDHFEHVPGDHDCEDAYERALYRVRTEGVAVAVGAAIDLCKMKSGPAQARSAAVNALFRAAGLFDKRENDGEPEPHEMTAEQLEREARRLTRVRDDLKRKLSEGGECDDGPGGVFD